MIKILQRLSSECDSQVYEMYKTAVEEEKAWAKHLFKDGSIIGLNDRLLSKYVEFIANKRLKALGMELNV